MSGRDAGAFRGVRAALSALGVFSINVKACVRYLVSGQVQGVFFRASARKQALARALTGWARNLSDGRVEVVAYGDESALNGLRDWLWVGPTHAHVKHVSAEPMQALDIGGFEIR